MSAAHTNSLLHIDLKKSARHHGMNKIINPLLAPFWTNFRVIYPHNCFSEKWNQKTVSSCTIAACWSLSGVLRSMLTAELMRCEFFHVASASPSAQDAAKRASPVHLTNTLSYLVIGFTARLSN